MASNSISFLSSGKRSILRFAVWPIVLLPPLFIAIIIRLYGLDIPHMDQWEMVPLLQAASEHKLTFAQLWVPHNEHRLVIPRLIMLAMAWVTDWDIRYELLINFLFALVILTILERIIRKTVKRFAPETSWLTFLLSLTASIMTFSITQWHNWVWGWQIQIFANVLGAITVAWAVSQEEYHWPWIILGLLGALGATLSFANGLLLFFLFAGGLWLSQGIHILSPLRTGLIAAFALGITLTAIYLVGIKVSPQDPFVFVGILPYLRYTLAYIGSGLGLWSLSVSIAWGAVGFSVLFVAVTYLRIRNSRNIKTITPFLLLACFSILSAVLSAFGRIPFGEKQALASRYVTISSLFWIAVVVAAALAVIQLRQDSQRSQAFKVGVLSGLGFLALLAILSTGISWNTSFKSLQRYHGTHQIGLECVRQYEKSPDKCLRIHYPDPTVLRERARWLDANHLTLFGKVSRR
jgi:hypothetical protein